MVCELLACLCPGSEETREGMWKWNTAGAFLTAGFSAWSDSQYFSTAADKRLQQLSLPQQTTPRIYLNTDFLRLYVFNTCVTVHVHHDKVSSTEL